MFSCHFVHRIVLFLTDWNSSLSLCLSRSLFLTDLFSAQLDLWSREHKVVFFSFWRDSYSVMGKLSGIIIPNGGIKFDGKHLFLLVIHFYLRHNEHQAHLWQGEIDKWISAMVLFLIASKLIRQHNMSYKSPLLPTHTQLGSMHFSIKEKNMARIRHEVKRRIL